jgi:hypothetical protein
MLRFLQRCDPILQLTHLMQLRRRERQRDDRSNGTTDQIERAVRSTIVRLMLVEQQNRLLALGLNGDFPQVALLQLLKPLVLTGRVDEPTEVEWIEHAGRLVDEARLWSEGADLIGKRYLAGHAPLFPDVQAALDGVREDSLELLDAYNAAAARTRGRRPHGSPVDLGLIDAHVAELLEAHVAGVVQGARLETEAFLGERTRTLRLERLVGMGVER